MKAGIYYVGDLCYVMTNSEWQEVCQEIYPPGVTEMRDGEFFINGKFIAIYGTKYGDGTYEDQEGKQYPVDSGTIGCILVSDIDPSMNVKDALGNIIEFKEDFETYELNGVLVFDTVRIDTDPREEDPDFDFDDDQEYNDYIYDLDQNNDEDDDQDYDVDEDEEE